MAPTATGYASTIYPDSPTIDTRGSGSRGVRECSACRAQRRQEEVEFLEETQCDCRDSRHRRRRSHEPKTRNTRPFTDTSSDEEAEKSPYLSRRSGKHRRRRGDPELRPLAEPVISQRNRHHSSRSGRRNVSRAPRLPSLAQLSFNYQPSGPLEPFSDQLERRELASRDRSRDRGDVGAMYVGSHASSPSRYRHLENESYLPQPDDLRMDKLQLRDAHEDYEQSHERRARSPVVSNSARPHSAMIVNESPYLQTQSPRVFQTMHQDRSCSRDRNNARLAMSQSLGVPPVQRYPINPSEEALSQRINVQRGDDCGEVYPLSSKKLSPSRMHRHYYAGNQPATVTTHSKLHPSSPAL